MARWLATVQSVTYWRPCGVMRSRTRRLSCSSLSLRTIRLSPGPTANVPGTGDLGRRFRVDAAVSLSAGPGRSQNALSALICAQICAQIVFGVRSGLRHPRQLTAHAIASETFSTVTYVLVAARAVQRRRPRIAAGRALSAAGSLARLRAASAEPLQ
jgi:hypothetical protein